MKGLNKKSVVKKAEKYKLANVHIYGPKEKRVKNTGKL